MSSSQFSGSSSFSLSRDVRAEIEHFGFSLVRGEEFKFSDSTLASWNALSESWDNLPLDEYMTDAGKYRRRRFGRLHFNPATQEVARLPHAAFVQTAELNSFAGDIERWFEPLEEKVFDNSCLLDLVSFNFSFLPLPSELKDVPWEIKIQQVRISAEPNSVGRPSPEGIHRDGFNFFTLHLMQRHNITGGVTSIQNDERETLREFTLLNPLDTVYVEDSRVLHGVSDIALDNQDAEIGYRDLLIINYDYQPNLLKAEMPRAANA